MARGNDQAQQAAKEGVNLAGTNATEAGGVYNALAPELESQAIHPPGINPTALAEMDTAQEQSAGGSEGAGVGQGALRAARTRNVGGSNASSAASTRAAGEQLSKGVLGNQIANEKLKEEQMSGAQRELGGLFSTTTSGANQSLGETASDVNANTAAANSSLAWDQFLYGPIIKGASGAITGGMGGP